VGAVYEPGAGPRPILSVIVTDLALLQLQPIPAGRALAILIDPPGAITTATHHVEAGAVVEGPPPAAPPPPPTVAEIRSIRDGLLMRTLWAVSDDSPLTNQSQHALRAYRANLRRWLQDHPGQLPPDPPDFEYQA
jgi:hypothetical protein